MATDFSTGPVWKNIVKQAVPLTIAQMVQILYNIVDRIYIGHLPEIGKLALTGIGLTFPVGFPRSTTSFFIQKSTP